MAYLNTSYAYLKSAEEYVEDNWVYSDSPSFSKKHLLARGAYFFLAPASLITSAIDTIVGLGAGIGTICTAGRYPQPYKFAMNHLSSSNKLFSHLYLNFLRAINPEAPFMEDGDNPPRISINGDGFLSDLVISPLRKTARSCYNSNNFLKRHVASRLTYAVLALSCLVTRAVDGVIGIVAASLSILRCGKIESLNHLAYRALQAPGIINDLFYCIIKCINPWTGR